MFDKSTLSSTLSSSLTDTFVAARMGWDVRNTSDESTVASELRSPKFALHVASRSLCSSSAQGNCSTD